MTTNNPHLSHLPAKGTQGTRTRSGFKTIGDELQALWSGEAAIPLTPYSPRKRTVSVKLDERDFTVLERAAKAKGLSVSAFVRRGLIATVERLDGDKK